MTLVVLGYGTRLNLTFLSVLKHRQAGILNVLSVRGMSCQSFQTPLLKGIFLTIEQPEHISSTRPIILDDHYESPETAALHEEGYEGALVARAGSPSDLLSMSAYGKPQPPPNLQGP